MTFLYFTWCPPVREPPRDQFALLSGSWIFPQVRGLFGVNLPLYRVAGFSPGTWPRPG